MTKQQMLDAIENAKNVHIKQMKKIESVLDGKKIDDPTALGKMECECGQWFHANEQEIIAILGMQFFERLDKHHEVWHLNYASIYKLLFVEEKKGLFSKVLSSITQDSMKIDKAKFYYTQLQRDTFELLKTSEAASRRVIALSDAKFK